MNDKYDVVIIGAGIGALVCGCYLAKAGLKVLIVEQHTKPGGYCTSFNRKGFKFDVGVHYLGSLRQNGILFTILRDLDLLGKIEFLRCDIIDKIVSPRKTLFIWRNNKKTIEELIMHFPKEKENIINFFEFVINEDFLQISAKTKRASFKELLDYIFIDYRLKSILSMMLLGCLGLPPSKTSALIAVILYREFIFDGGYYHRTG